MTLANRETWTMKLRVREWQSGSGLDVHYWISPLILVAVVVGRCEQELTLSRWPLGAWWPLWPVSAALSLSFTLSTLSFTISLHLMSLALSSLHLMLLNARTQRLSTFFSSDRKLPPPVSHEDFLFCKSTSTNILLRIKRTSISDINTYTWVCIRFPGRHNTCLYTFYLKQWNNGNKTNCVTRAPLLYFVRSWVALSLLCESVSQASVTPVQISTFCNI